MKKLFLFVTAGVISLGAGAQSIKTHSMVRVDALNQLHLPVPQAEALGGLKVSRTLPAANDAQHKPTAGGSRLYNYVETIAALNPGIASNQVYPYMWFRPDIMGAYTDPNNPNGVIADTIRFGSFAQVLHPSASILNNAMYFDGNYPNPTGTLIGISKDDAYTLDSVSVTGFYARNINNSTTVDTLRFAIIYGDGTSTSNIPESGFVSGDIRFGTVFHDSVLNVGTGIQGGPSVEYRDLYLTTADTGIDGNTLPKFTVPAGVNIPAGNMVAVTVTFKSGDDGNYTPYQDTAFLGTTWGGANPYKYGMFRPLFLEETLGQQPAHTPGNFNAGYIKYLPPYLFQSWEIQYLPHWAFTGPSQMEWPYIDFYISCATCKTVAEIPDDPDVNVNTISGVFSSISAYPNPAQDFVRIPVTLSKATDVKVSLINTVGQTLQAQNLHGNAVTAEFNTANLPAGVYIYSVEADGQRSTGRVSISR